MTYQKQRLLGKQNFVFVLIGLALILVGFFVMAGSATTDPNVYPEEAMYGFQRTVLAPLVILAGFAMQIVAIWTKADIPIIQQDAKATPTKSVKQQVPATKAPNKIK